jgi:hypothetical protein
VTTPRSPADLRRSTANLATANNPAVIVGFAMLFGGFLTQYISHTLRISVLMRVGLSTMIFTGLLLAIPFPADVDLNYVKLGVKLGITVLIGAAFEFATVAVRSGKAVGGAHFLAVGGLALLNAAVAIFWR